MIFTSLITISSFLSVVQFGGAVCRNSGDYEGVLDFHTFVTCTSPPKAAGIRPRHVFLSES